MATRRQFLGQAGAAAASAVVAPSLSPITDIVPPAAPGAVNETTGVVHEIIAVGRAISDVERTQITDYLNAKWLGPETSPMRIAIEESETPYDRQFMVVEPVLS